MGTLKKRRYCPEDDRMLWAEKQTPNHVLHLLLSIITGGAWLLVWIALAIGSDFARYKCSHCGANTKARPPWGWKQRKTVDSDAR